jgi:hypothetical protein
MRPSAQARQNGTGKTAISGQCRIIAISSTAAMGSLPKAQVIGGSTDKVQYDHVAAILPIPTARPIKLKGRVRMSARSDGHCNQQGQSYAKKPRSSKNVVK